MKKIGLLCLAVVLALGMVGAGFAYWTETLTIDPPVTLGELDAEFMDWYSVNYWTGMMGTTCSISKAGPQKLNVTMGNLYPSDPGAADTYARGGAAFTFAIQNTGSIPVKISDIVINKTGGNIELWSKLQTNYIVSYYKAWPFGHSGTYYASFMVPPTTDSWDILTPGCFGKTGGVDIVLPVLLPGEVFAFGDPDEEEGTMYFYVHKDTLDILENKTVDLDIVFTATQFNTP